MKEQLFIIRYDIKNQINIYKALIKPDNKCWNTSTNRLINDKIAVWSRGVGEEKEERRVRFEVTKSLVKESFLGSRYVVKPIFAAGFNVFFATIRQYLYYVYISLFSSNCIFKRNFTQGRVA